MHLEERTTSQTMREWISSWDSSHSEQSELVKGVRWEWSQRAGKNQLDWRMGKNQLDLRMDLSQEGTVLTTAIVVQSLRTGWGEECQARNPDRCKLHSVLHRGASLDRHLTLLASRSA